METKMIKDWPKDVPGSKPRKKGSSGNPKGALLWAAVALVGVPVLMAVAVLAFLAHGWGLI